MRAICCQYLLRQLLYITSDRLVPFLFFYLLLQYKFNVNNSYNLYQKLIIIFAMLTICISNKFL